MTAALTATLPTSQPLFELAFTDTTKGLRVDTPLRTHLAYGPLPDGTYLALSSDSGGEVLSGEHPSWREAVRRVERRVAEDLAA